MVDVWYPVSDGTSEPYNYGLGRGHVVEAGAIAAGRFPLIMLSHGALGAARNYSWIAEPLARAGYVVAGVSHFGESYVYGAHTVEPGAVLRFWERPLDVSAAVSYMIDASPLSAAIDRDRIGFVGHSSGGATGLLLAGGTFDAEKMAAYCETPEARADRGCDYAETTVDDEVKAPEDQNYRDDRVQALAILDPALGPGFRDFGGLPSDTGLLVVGSTDNDFLPFESHAGRIANLLPDVEWHWLAGGEGHFVYLNICGLEIEANGVPLCVDRDGVSRLQSHRDLITLVRSYFATRLD